MAQIRYESDVNPSLIRTKRVGVIGFGSQGHAHALNLRDSGVDVCVGLHESSKSRARAEVQGLEVLSVRQVAVRCDVIMVLAPDTAQPSIYAEEIAPALAP